MAEIMQARGGRGSRKRLKRIIVEKAKGGGHIVEHHMDQGGNEYHEPEKFSFGAGQGAEMMAHVGKHMGVKSEESTEDPKGPAMAAAPDSDTEDAEA